MSLTVGMRLRSRIVAIPHISIAKTIGRYAAKQYSQASPVRTGEMRDSWGYAVQRFQFGVILSIHNSAPHAGIVFKLQHRRFRKIPKKVQKYAAQVFQLVS